MISARSSAHLPGHLVGRDRLVAALGRPGARIVVVTGPAGSGKTVAVRQWAVTTPDPVAWLSLDPRHTDPEHFLDAVLIALEELVPGVLEAAFDDDPSDRGADRAVVRAVRHLAEAPVATVVLDDLHMIDRSRTTDLLNRLVGAMADTNLRLVICSRSDPPLRLHRFRLAGELVELRESDLRFSRGEAEEFFERFPEVDLAADQVERLAERTEGWAAGLQFAALSLRGPRRPRSGSSSGSPAATGTWPTSCSTRSCCASPTTCASSCWRRRCSSGCGPTCAPTSPVGTTPARCSAGSSPRTSSSSRSTTSASGSATTTCSRSSCGASSG